MSEALITGSAGFLGRHFAAELLTRGWQVRLMDIATRDADDILLALRYDTKKYDLVIHAAAQAPHRVGIDTVPSSAVYNALLDTTFFQWLIDTKQPRALYVSSSAVYADHEGDPHWQMRFTEDMGHVRRPFDRYGAGKRHGEELASVAFECGVNVTIVRPFSGYGYDQSDKFPYGAFRERIINRTNPFPIWGNESQMRDFIHVDDIVSGSLALIDHGVVNRPVNLCTGVPTSMEELARTFIDTARMLDDKPRRPPLIEVDPNAPMGVMYRVGDPTLLHDFYRPRWSLQDGITDTLRRAMETKRGPV